MKVTIKDIARETGLSLATISKYLNHKKIQEKNRILIEEAIRRLDYKPNRTAQTLRSKKTMTIGILLSDLGNYFWGALVSSVTQYFVKYNYTVIACSYYYEKQTEAEVIQDLIARNIDGIIMLPHNAADNLYHLLQDAHIPTILLDHLPCCHETYPIDCVLSDNYGGGARLAEYLIEKGHINIEILNPVHDSHSIMQRIQGILDTYQKHGLPLPIPAEPLTYTDTQQVMELGRKLFIKTMQSPHPPTAIFFTNYIIAMGGLTEASTSGYTIYDDISIVTFDDDPLFKSMYPPITSVSQDLSLIGKTASQLLLKRIQGDYSDFPCVSIIDVDFHERDSVKDISRETLNR